MSNTTLNRIQTAHRQTAYALNTNATAFVSQYWIEHCGFLTVAFPDRLYPIPARKKFRKALHLFPSYFQDWIWTIGLTKTLRIHYHALVACQHNVREGIDLSLYPRLLDLDANNALLSTDAPVAEQKAAIRKALRSNPALQEIRRELFPRLHKLGFGHQLDLSPVLSDGPAIAAYLESNYLDTVRRKNLLFRGMRLTGYQHGGHRVFRPPFGWVGAGPRRRRECIARVAAALGVTEYTEMKTVFGPKWGYLSNLLLLELQLRHGCDPQQWATGDIRHLAITEGMMPPLDLAA